MSEFFEAFKRAPVLVAEFDESLVASAAAEQLCESGIEARSASGGEIRAVLPRSGISPEAFGVVVARSDQVAAEQFLLTFVVEGELDAFTSPEVVAWSAEREERDRRKEEMRAGNAWRWRLVLAMVAIAFVVAGLVGALSNAS